MTMYEAKQRANKCASMTDEEKAVFVTVTPPETFPYAVQVTDTEGLAPDAPEYNEPPYSIELWSK